MVVFRFMLDYVERVRTGAFAVRVRGNLYTVNFLFGFVTFITPVISASVIPRDVTF